MAPRHTIVVLSLFATIFYSTISATSKLYQEDPPSDDPSSSRLTPAALDFHNRRTPPVIKNPSNSTDDASSATIMNEDLPPGCFGTGDNDDDDEEDGSPCFKTYDDDGMATSKEASLIEPCEDSYALDRGYRMLLCNKTNELGYERDRLYQMLLELEKLQEPFVLGSLISVIQDLLDAGAAPLFVDEKTGNTPLHLLAKIANIDQKTYKDIMLLFAAKVGVTELFSCYCKAKKSSKLTPYEIARKAFLDPESTGRMPNTKPNLPFIGAAKEIFVSVRPA